MICHADGNRREPVLTLGDEIAEPIGIEFPQKPSIVSSYLFDDPFKFGFSASRVLNYCFQSITNVGLEATPVENDISYIPGSASRTPPTNRSERSVGEWPAIEMPRSGDGFCPL